MKLRLYFSLLLAMLLTSCELYMDNLPTPDETEGADPKEEVVTIVDSGTDVSYQYTQEVVELTPQYDQYILANLNDSILLFSESTPTSFLPKPGDVLYSNYTEMFPMGLARKVLDVSRKDGMFYVDTEQATYEDVYTHLNIDATNAQYPTVYLSDEAAEPEIRMPSSRAVGDTETVDGVTFTTTSHLTFSLSLNIESCEFKKHFTGSAEGALTVTLVQQQAVLQDEVDVFDGKVIRHEFSRTKISISGDLKASGSATFKPFEELLQKLAQVTASSGGPIGFVIYPDLTVTFKMEGQFSGTWTNIQVKELYGKCEDFDFKKAKLYDVKDKYDAGSELTGELTGSLSIKFEINFRVGVAIAGGTVEVGGYIKFSVEPKLTLASDGNAHDLSFIDEYGDEVEVTARSNSGFSCDFGIEEYGLWVRVGLPESLVGPFSKLTSKFKDKLNPSLSNSNIVILDPHFSEGFGIVYLNIKPIAVYILKKDYTYCHLEWPFYPQLNTQISTLYCSNNDFSARTYNRIMGKIRFDNDGLFDYKNLRLYIFDYDDNFLCIKSDKYNSAFAPLEANKTVEFDFNLDLYDFAMEETDYYKIYPVYMDKNNKKYCDRCFIVKNRRPSITTSALQLAYYHTKDSGVSTWTYTVRAWCDIQSTSEVGEWGLKIYLDNYRPKSKLTADDVKKLYKCLGTLIFEKGPDGEIIATRNGKSVVDIDIETDDYTLEGMYVIILPFYKKVGKTNANILYGDAAYVSLANDESLNDKYSYELNNLPDYNFFN